MRTRRLLLAIAACVFASSGAVMLEAATAARPAPTYLPELMDFRQGKLYPNDRPGLGVTLNEDFIKRHLVAESGA